MKRIVSLITLIILVSASPLTAVAHEGHGHENPLSPGHYIVNPEHFIPLALAVAAVVAIIAVRIYKVKHEK